MPTAAKTVFNDAFKALMHELTQPLASILTNARVVQHMLDDRRLDREEVRAILEDIARQDKRAGEMVVRLRHLLQDTEAEPPARRRAVRAHARGKPLR